MPGVKVRCGVVRTRAPSTNDRASNATLAVLTHTLSIRSQIERFAEGVAQVELQSSRHWMAQLDLGGVVTAESVGIPNDQRSILGRKKALRCRRITAAWEVVGE